MPGDPEAVQEGRVLDHGRCGAPLCHQRTGAPPDYGARRAERRERAEGLASTLRHSRCPYRTSAAEPQLRLQAEGSELISTVPGARCAGGWRRSVGSRAESARAARPDEYSTQRLPASEARLPSAHFICACLRLVPFCACCALCFLFLFQALPSSRSCEFTITRCYPLE